MRGLLKTGRRRFGLALLVAVAGLVTAGLLGGVANAGACQVFAEKEWDGGAGTQEWHDANNWNPDGVPGPTHDVCIDNATSTVFFISGTTDILSLDAEDPLQISGGTLNLTDTTANSEATSLTLTNGTLGGAGTLVVQPGGIMIWSGGIMTGPGTTRISPASGGPQPGALSIQGTATKTISGGRTLDNQGTAIWTGASDISSGQGAVIDNSGTFDIQNDQTLAYNQGGNRTQFNNSSTGTLTKSAGAGTADLQAAVDNDGTVTSTSGNLLLSAGTTFNDDVADLSTGDFLATVGDTLSFSGTTHRLGGAGSSVFGAGTIAFPGGATHVGADTDYEVTGTTAIIGGTANFNTLPASSPTTTNLTLSAGVLGGTGELAVPGIGSWTGGSMADTGTTIFFGTLDISGAAAKTITQHTLDNDGVTTWTGASDINSGQSAVIENSGTFIIQNDQTLIYNQGGTRLLFNNTGEIARTAPGTGTAQLQATVDNSPAGGGEGTIRVSSGTLFLNGTGSLANYNATTDTLSEGKYIIASATFKFTDADIDVNDADILLDGATSAIVDAANVDALGDFTDNQDTFVILNGRDLTTTVPVSNSGIMTISNGIFTATGDYTQTDGETFIDAAPSELVATGGCVDIQGGVLKGKGTAGPCVDVTGGNVQPGFSPGILNVDGTYSQSAGTLDIEIGGTTAGTQHDQLAVTGAATLGGTLALDTFGTFTPSDGDSFVVMTFASRTGTFASETWADLDPSLGFTVQYNPTNVTVVVEGTAAPTVSIGDDTVTEGDAGTVDAEFAVTLSEPAPAGGVTVDYDTADDTATSLDDYVAESGTVTFVEGDDTETVTIAVNGDTDVEPDETFFVDLSDAVNATIADGQGVGTILDDDGTGTADVRVIKKDAGREPKILGKGFRYNIRVTNVGPDGATELTLVDTLPDEVAFVSYRASQGTCTHDSGEVTCDLGSLASATFARVSILVRAVGCGTATNSVTVSAAETDPLMTNNSDTEDTAICPSP